jgi:N-formylglutamate deformylase
MRALAYPTLGDNLAMTFNFNAESSTTSLRGRHAVVLDSPHSGTCYPDDFQFACDALLLRQAEDTHVEKLYDFCADLGVAWVEAHFPRSYLDANRNTTEIDSSMLDAAWPGGLETDVQALSKVRLGKGLIWRFTDQGLPIYDRVLTVAEVQRRITHCWQPYHAAVKQAIDAAHAQHGYSIHLNCHSMPAVSGSHATDFPGLRHTDIVIGNRDESTSSRALALWICAYFRALGYSVAYNHPYKGVELVRRYGNPEQHRHSIQVEINRELYMDEVSFERHAGFQSLQSDLRVLVERLLVIDPRHI